MGWDILATGLVELLKIMFTRKKPSDAIRDSINIRIKAEELVFSGLSIDCFFIVMAHNGARRMKPHGFKYWSIIDGSYDELTMPKFRYVNYQNTIMDLEFAQLVDRVYTKKEVFIKVEELPEGNLRTAFEYEGLEFIKIFYLKQDTRALWFIMVGTAAPGETLASTLHKQQIFLAVNKVKNIIRGY